MTSDRMFSKMAPYARAPDVTANVSWVMRQAVAHCVTAKARMPCSAGSLALTADCSAAAKLVLVDIVDVHR